MASGSGGESAARRRLRNRVVPTAVVRAARLQRALAVGTLRAAARLGRRPQVELYLAFDDPYAAVALPGLVHVCALQRAQLRIYPVVDHGLAGDPDAPLRRAHALIDADRLLQRTGQRLARKTALEPEAVRFAARWTEAARLKQRALPFASAAITWLWLELAGEDDRAPRTSIEAALSELYVRAVGEPAPAAEQAAALDARLAHNARQLRARGHWETPAARIAGQWFFAHERLSTIEALLAEVNR